MSYKGQHKDQQHLNMDSNYLQDLWNWSSGQDPTLKERYTFDDWSQKIQSDGQYRQRFYDWIGDVDPTHDERRPYLAWERLVTTPEQPIKKKEESVSESEEETTLSDIPGVGEVSLTGFTRGSRYDAAPVGATPEEVEAAQIQREEQAAPVVGREMIDQYTPEAFDPVKEREKADIAAERDDLSGVSLGYVIDDLLDNTYLERFGEKISEDIEASGVQAEVADLASIVSDSGKEYNEEDVKNLVAAYNKMIKMPPTQAMKSWDRDYEKNGKGIYAFMAATLSNPSAVREVAVRSLGGMLQSKKALTAGATGGGAALITGLGAIPTAMATANAVFDANLSFAEFLFEEAQKKGYKKFTEEAVISVLKDPEALRRARYRAVGRGAAIGIIDRATFGLAKGVVSSVAKKTGVKGLAALTGTTVEMAGGSTSEVAARLVADQEMDLKDIGFEAIGELGTAPVSVVTGLTSIPEYKINGQVVSGPKMAEAIRKAPDDSFSRMRVSIKNDEELYNAAKERKDKLIVRKAVNETIKATVGRANKEDVDAIVELELKKQELSKKRGSKSREELKNIESQIDELYNKIESEDYAVQEQSTDEVPVQPDAAISEEVEEGVPETKPEELTEQEEKELGSLQFEEATTEDDIEYRSELVEKSRKNAPAEAEVVRISRDDSGNVIAGEIEFIQDGETVTEKIKIAPVEQGTQAPIEGTKLRDNIKKAIAKVFTKTDSRSFKNGKDMSEYAKEKYGQDIGQDEGARVFIKQDGSIEILVNEELADDTSFGHEVWHPILLKAFGDNQNKFTAFRKSINKTLRNNGYVELADNLDEFANQYKETEVPAEEYLAQLGGILTAANIDVANLTEADKTLLQQIKEIVNNIMVELTGQPVFLDDATPKDILNFMSTMSDMMARGEDVSGFVKEAPGINIENTSDVFTSRAQKMGNFEIRYFEDETQFKKLVDDGLVVQNSELDDISGENVAIHQPDNLLVGDVYYKDKKIMDANGGVYYVLKFGNVWASGKKSSATALANLINNSRKKSTDGKGRLVLVRGSQDKMISSVQGVKAAMEILESLMTDNLISKSDFRKALNTAGKKYKINFSGSNSAESIKKDIQEKFMNVEDSTFAKRGDFFSDLVSEIGKLPSAKENIKEIQKALGATKNISFSKQGIRQQIGLVLTERLLSNLPSSHAYAYIEVDEDVDVRKDEQHESYPWSIKMKSGKKPKLHILKERPKATEAIRREDGSKASNAQLGLAQRGMGSGLIPKVLTRAQKKVPSDYKKIASEKLTSKEFNAVRSSIKRTAPDSFAAEALDAIASKDDFDLGISSLNERVEEIKEDGVTFGNLVSLIAEDEEILDIKGLETSRDVADYLLNIGQVGRLQKMASRALAETRAQKWPTSLTQEQVDQKLKEAGIRTKTENDRFLEDEGKGNETQRNNIKTYDTFVGGILNSFGDDVRILDIGAGFGIGAMAAKKQNVADIYKTYEPFPSLSDGKWEKFSGTKKPNYTKESQVPKESADVIVSNAVLNVVPQDIRDGIVNLIGDSLAPGGKAYISVRGIKEEALAKALKNSKEGKGKNVFLSETEYYVPGVQGDYQKGFSPEELKAYVQDTLGSDYTVEVSKDSFWKNSSSAPKVVVSKKGEGVLTRAQKASSERMQKELDGVIEKARKRGADKQRVYDDALAYLQGTKVYEEADDVAREKMVRDLNKKLGVKEKRVPKIFATRKNTDKVTVNEKKALLDMIRAQAKAAKNAASAQRGIAKALNDELKMLFKKGFISTRQMKAIINKALSLNFFNDDHVVKFVEYVEKVYNNAEYADKLKSAESIKRRIKRFTKNKDLQAETRDIAKRFLEIEPFFAENIDEYLKIANQILEATSTTVGKVVEGEATVSLKQAMDYGVVTEYTDKALTFQEKIKKEQLLRKNKELVESGVLDEAMSLEEMKLVVQAIEENPDIEDAAEKEKMIRDFVNKYYESYKTIISEITRTQSDPFTGERIFLTKEQINLVKRFMKINLDTLSLKDAFKIVESIDNFIVNQNTDGMLGLVEAFEGANNAKIAKRQGFKARRLRTFFSKRLGGAWAEQIEQLPLLINRMFGGEFSGAKWDKLSGLSDLMAVKNKAFSKYNKYVENYSKQFEGIKDFNSLENIFSRAMLAYVSRTSQGSKIQQDAEFKKRKKNIETSISALKKNGNDRQKKDAEILEKVYDKILRDANTASEVSSRSSKTNRLAVSYWQAAFSDIFDDMQKVSRGVYNTILERDFKYTPDTYSRFGKRKDAEQSIEDIVNSSSFFGINDNFDTKESGSMMKATKPQLSADPARVVSFDFDSNMARALQAAIIDIETAPIIRKVDAFYSSKEISDIIEADDLEVLRARVAGYIKATKRKEFKKVGKLGDISKFLNYISTFGAARALAGVSQVVKQTIPVVANTMITSGGRTGITDVIKAKDFIDKSGYAIGLRGIASQADIQTMNKILKRAEESKGMKALNALKELNQFFLETLVAKPDIFVARASWIAYYKQSLANQGIDTNIEWDTHTLNKEAADYAQRKVDKQQNYSDADLAGDFFRSKDQNVALLRKALFPFATFMLNKRSALIGDVSTLQNKLASKEDKKAAILSLTANSAEMAIFHSVSILIGSTLYGIIAEALAGGDEEDKRKKEERELRGKMYRVKNAVNEYISPVPGITDVPVDYAINKLLDIVGVDAEYKLPEDKDQSFFDKIGMLNITTEKLIKANEMIGIAVEGKVGEKEMSEEDKKSMRLIAGIYGMYAMGTLPADLGSISNKAYYMVISKYKGRKKRRGKYF